MKLLLPILLATPAYAGDIEDAKFTVDNHLSYLFYYGDHRPADAKPDEQNCLGFARAYLAGLHERGKEGVILPCHYQKAGKDVPHVYVLSEGKVLDNRFSTVVSMEDYDCN